MSNKPEKNNRVGLFGDVNDDAVDKIDDIGNLDDFKPKKKGDSVNKAVAVEEIAKANNFPSRNAHKEVQPERRKQRKYVTGRNQQFNMKLTIETVNEFYRLAELINVPHGRLMELALEALVNSNENYKEK